MLLKIIVIAFQKTNGNICKHDTIMKHDKSTHLSNKEVLELLAEAQQQYEEYVALSKITELIFDSEESIAEVPRDMNHPLLIAFK